jgi:hypothetical protein
MGNDFVARAWRRANDYLESAWASCGYPEEPMPDVGQGAHWMIRNAPRAWEQIKAGGSAFRRSVAEAEHEIAAAGRLLARKGIAAVRVTWQRDPEIMAAVAVLGVYEPQLIGAVAAYKLTPPAVSAIKKLARKHVLDDREWAHMHDALDAFATAG